jgi:DNA-binding transcriptional ArsR family regulator
MINAERALDALGDRTRRRIFVRLRDRPHYAGELVRGMRVTRSAVSQHLQVLRAAGLIKVRADRCLGGVPSWNSVCNRGLPGMHTGPSRVAWRYGWTWLGLAWRGAVLLLAFALGRAVPIALGAFAVGWLENLSMRPSLRRRFPPIRHKNPRACASSLISTTCVNPAGRPMLTRRKFALGPLHCVRWRPHTLASSSAERCG